MKKLFITFGGDISYDEIIPILVNELCGVGFLVQRLPIVANERENEIIETI